MTKSIGHTSKRRCNEMAKISGKYEVLYVIDIPKEDCGNWKKLGLIERVKYFLKH